jgi:hypothetical protein
MNANALIPNQVKLPLRIACEVVLQGLRIRLGRSIVTITGVICGIAFLMSILTGQIVKRGVTDEDARREEVGRMTSFIRSDLPKLHDRTIGVVGGGALSEVETRVLEHLAADAGAILLLERGAPALRRPIVNTRVVSGERLAEEAAVVFIMGDGTLPAFDWTGYFELSLNNLAAITVAGLAFPEPSHAERKIQLARAWSQEELDAKAQEARKERFRGVWITIISLLVTVIGITNAMLMSVTERFREIGTMKCLGALSGFVTRMFVLEASIMGFVGGLLGALLGAAFALSVYVITYGGNLVFSALPAGTLGLYALSCTLAGVALSIVAALYPARVAASMVPATALRSTV